MTTDSICKDYFIKIYYLPDVVSIVICQSFLVSKVKRLFIRVGIDADNYSEELLGIVSHEIGHAVKFGEFVNDYLGGKKTFKQLRAEYINSIAHDDPFESAAHRVVAQYSGHFSALSNSVLSSLNDLPEANTFLSETVHGTRYEYRVPSDRTSLTGKVINGDSYYNRTIIALWQMIMSYNNGGLPDNVPQMKETRVDTDIKPTAPLRAF